jgi:uncharacterized delta-60 repeat protein
MLVRQMIAVGSLAVVFAAVPVASGLAAPATLDPSFSGDGKAITNFTPSFDGAKAVAVQADGKIVLVGGAGSAFALARYEADGTLDPTFGGDGRVTTKLSKHSDVALAVAIKPSGEIVVAGQARRFSAGGMFGRFALAQYESDGTLDATFSGDGKVLTTFTTGWDGASGVAIQADGKVVVAGSANLACSCGGFALARYTSGGALDDTFGGDGKVTTWFRGGGSGNDVAIQSNGRIVVVGGNPPDAARFQVARYNTDGTLDATFNGDGKATTNMGQGEEAATGVAIQSNGKVVVAGFTDGPHEFGDAFGPGKFAIARYLVDGTLDAAFGGDGKVKTRFGRTGVAAESLAIQVDGKIVAAGTGAGAGGRFALARYHPGGALDTTFSGDGRIFTDLTPGEDLAFGVALQADGKIVAAGQAGGGGGRFGVARYLGG